MGQPKLLMPWRGRPLLAHVLETWTACTTHTVLVARPDASRIAELATHCGAAVVQPDPPPVDMTASVQAALRAIQSRWAPQPHDVWLLAPADMPRLPNAAIHALLARHREQPDCAWVATYDGRRGHPLLAPWPYAGTILALPPEQNVRDAMRAWRVEELPCDEATVLEDIDDPADYKRLTEEDKSAEGE